MRAQVPFDASALPKKTAVSVCVDMHADICTRVYLQALNARVDSFISSLIRIAF